MVVLILLVGFGFLRQKFRPSPSSWIEPGVDVLLLFSSRMWTCLLFGLQKYCDEVIWSRVFRTFSHKGKEVLAMKPYCHWRVAW